LGLRPTSLSTQTVPELSVIIPLIDDHGLAEACLESWLGQQIDRARIQFVVVDPGQDRERATRLRSRLRDHDLWLECSDPVDVAHYELGGRNAAAPLLLFTEAHCTARPGAAEVLLDVFRDPEVAAASVGSGHLPSKNDLTAMQAVLERTWFPSWPAGHPRTVSLRGFAIRKDVFVAAGGFVRRYGRFAETALAIAVARSGQRIARTPDLLDHANCPSYRELVQVLKDCATGQLVWRTELDEEEPGAAEEWLDDVEVWARRSTLAPDVAGALLQAIGASLFGDLGRRGAAAKAAGMLRKLPWLLAGSLPNGAGLRAFGRFRSIAAAVRWSMARALRSGLPSSYVFVWRSAFERGFLDYLASHPVPPAWASVDTRPRSIATMPVGSIAGDDGASAAPRWLGAAGLLRLQFPAQHGWIRIRCRWPGTPDDACLTAFFNGRRVPADALRIDDDRISIRVRPEECNSNGRQELVLTSRVFRAHDVGETGNHLLGVALFDVALAPDG
jgi:hypothetical protein